MSIRDPHTMPRQTGPNADPEASVWKALADPTRRRILDLLRAGPRTTGALAGGFETTRFAIMKHLDVLVGAGLVLVTRHGRERHNHLNITPLQAIHERWTTPLAADAAASLLRLKRTAEQTHPSFAETQTAETGPTAETAEITMSQADPNSPSPAIDAPSQTVVEVSIDAPRLRVWDAFLNETDAWWRPDFRTDPRTQSVLLEPRVGGRLYEDYGNGDGLLWATVVVMKSGERIDLVGVAGPEWGGPHTGYHSFTFQDRGDQTVVRLTDSYHGHITPKTLASLEEGWKLLIGEGLKPYVEASV